MDFDLKTDEGLRSAFEAKACKIEPERLDRVTRFLEEVAATPSEERATVEFQRKIWREKSAVDMQDRLGERIEDPEFAKWFVERLPPDLPADPTERNQALARVHREIVNRIHELSLKTNEKADREWMQVRRTLVHLYPAHTAGTCHGWRIWQLTKAMGGPSFDDESSSPHRRTLQHFWIRNRLDEVLDEPKGMRDHALRVLVSGKLATMVNKKERSVWLFRAGDQGQEEEAWLAHGLAFIRWREVGDLSAATDDNAIREACQAAYPGEKSKSIGFALGNLRPFATGTKPGDLAILPRKRRDFVSIGIITGIYSYREVNGEFRHTLPVEWKKREIPRGVLDPETRKKLGAYQTVLHLGGSELAKRLEDWLNEPGLEPLPATRRQRSIPLRFDEVLHLVERVGDRRPFEEVLEELRAENPNWKKNSAHNHFHRVAAPLGVLRRAGSNLEVTELGKELLASGDPDALRDRLLTTVFGPDHVLVELSHEPLASGVLVKHLQRVNPGFRTTAGPDALLACLRSLDLIASEGGKNQLTERGRRWRSAIHWPPEPLPGPLPPPAGRVEPPPVAEVVKKVTTAAAERTLDFDRKLIENLHYGLWSHERRHFAILAGLSGSGKTQLAWKYARAVTGAEGVTDDRFAAVSVAPGWHDPTQLLGYVNPVNGIYVGTWFQKSLMSAAENPTEVHACVLDEMNLSHPEQYLAPLLSAMEQEGGMIEFHDGDEEDLGVPGRILYPANLVLIGTVNMDETTMGLSDKVLDRAFTLEFWDINVDAWPGWADCRLKEADRVQRVLTELMAALRPARLHFGWRVIAECVAFLTRHEEGKGDATEALDTVLYAKLLPKLRGDDSERYRKALDTCRKVLEKENLKQSKAKVQELIEDMQAIGHFKFWR